MDFNSKAIADSCWLSIANQAKLCNPDCSCNFINYKGLLNHLYIDYLILLQNCVRLSAFFIRDGEGKMKGAKERTLKDKSSEMSEMKWHMRGDFREVLTPQSIFFLLTSNFSSVVSHLTHISHSLQLKSLQSSALKSPLGYCVVAEASIW